jgi:putative acetyltransferase
MDVQIAQERPDHPEAAALVEELEEHLAAFYPAESRHGLSVERLIAEQVAFFVVRVDGAPAACGGVKLVGREYGELKRMYVRPAFRGRGLARLLIDRLAEHARAAGSGLLRLETGVHQRAAIALYEGVGFRRIPPFGPYREDPLSMCFEMPIAPAEAEGDTRATG